MTQKQPPKGSTIQDERPPIRAIKDIEADHPDEWVVLEITKMAEDGFTPLEGRLMAHAKDRDELRETVKAYRKKYEVHATYRNYTGEMQVEAVLL